MFKKSTFTILFTLVAIAFAAPQSHAQSRRRALPKPKYSSKRLEGERWQDAFKRTYRLKNFQTLGMGSALDNAVPLKEVDLSKLATFPGQGSGFGRAFLGLRDLRFLNDPEVRGFKRRLSWMYPDDGCFIRAEWLAKLVADHYKKPQVSKIFAFGNLKVNTKNHPDGYVTWWYHVVVGWAFQGKSYVFDPAIDPKKPMLLKDWVGSIDQDLNDVKLSICKAGTYNPDSDCDEVQSTMSKEQAATEASYYLSAERVRLKQMGRNADQELGEHPPWLVQGRRY